MNPNKFEEITSSQVAKEGKKVAKVYKYKPKTPGDNQDEESSSEEEQEDRPFNSDDEINEEQFNQLNEEEKQAYK